MFFDDIFIFYSFYLHSSAPFFTASHKTRKNINCSSDKTCLLLYDEI